jgi:hypothetical protein
MTQRLSRSPLQLLASSIAAVSACAIFAPAAHAGTTSTFLAAADAHVQSDLPTSNFGSGTRMVTDGDPQAQVLIRFSVSGLSGTVTGARLRLFANNPSDDGPSLYRVGGAWSESGVTWNSRPAPTGAALGKLGVVPQDSWVELDVTAAVAANGTYDFMLVSASGDGSSYHSREAANPPQLVITTDVAPPPPPPPPPTGTASVDVTLRPAAGVTGTQRVNFAVPLAPGQLHDGNLVRVLSGGIELPAARRELAYHPDGSVRSVQLQVQTAVTAGQVLQIRLGETPTTASLALAAVSTTLVASDGTSGPRVWALLPAAWLSASGVTGPQLPDAQATGAIETGLGRVCDYENHSITAFLPADGTKDSWLYDRGTAMYRGHARRGDFLTLDSAYRETAMYRNGVTGTGTSTRIGVPGASDDLKYHYTQNLAIHYLLTGDDRFREAAENVAERVAALWSSPGYAGGDDFWTERHAGFALLAYVWADIVTDDHGTEFQDLADAAVDAYLAVQAQYPPGWTDGAARCFGHQASAHGEDYGTWGCSPWMSAILADGLDAYATLRGGTRAAAARASIVKLGRILASQRDARGKPFYWLGVGTAADVVDDYDEHWGESAYVVAMAWHWSGRTDAALRAAADSLANGLATYGTSPYLRSFNWQCRSAVAAPFYLQ